MITSFMLIIVSQLKDVRFVNINTIVTFSNSEFTNACCSLYIPLFW